jgi:acyl-coenzyme A thioesterase PaaI-like protein
MATTLGNEEGFATADLHISYLRPVRGCRLRFEGVVLSRGRQVGHVEVQFTSYDGELVARAHATEVVTAGPRRRGLGDQQ